MRVCVRVCDGQRLELEGCVINVAEHNKKKGGGGSKQGKAAAKKKKQDQFERVKQAKNKKKGRQPPPVPKTPNKEAAEKSEDDEYAPRPHSELKPKILTKPSFTLGPSRCLFRNSNEAVAVTTRKRPTRWWSFLSAARA
jgi:hypothetical protein